MAYREAFRASAPAWSPGTRARLGSGGVRHGQAVEGPGRAHRRGRHREARHRRPVVEGALERFGRIDTLVDDAGVFVSKPFTDYTAEDYALVIGVNLHRVLLADPARHRRDGDAVRRPRRQHLGHPGRRRELRHARGPGRADQGRPGRGHPVAGRRVRLPRHPGQRRLARHHPDPGAPGRKLRRPPRPGPLGRARQVSENVVYGILFLESSPYITGEILHVDGGQIAGH